MTRILRWISRILNDSIQASNGRSVTAITKKYGSDLIVDLLHTYDIPYIACNPGATFRGIHDSVVNYGGNKPEIIECQHEEIAVQIAHGYAKVTGKPMAVILHNVVGLLHSNLAIYYAYLDRAPILILGATGPMEVARRRPRVDWDHTAVIQGNAVRDYVKWDDQPFGAAGVVHSFQRGYRMAMTEPQGPVYICYDVAFQEDLLQEEVKLPASDKAKLYSRIGPEPEVLSKAVEMLISAENPVIVADFVGRQPERVETLVELAECLGASVIDINGRMNFPNTHPLFSMSKKLLQDADVVLALDVRDLHGLLHTTDDDLRLTGRQRISDNCKVIEITVNDLEVSSWAQNIQRFQPVDISILADTYVALPELLSQCKAKASMAPANSSIANNKTRIEQKAKAHKEDRQYWQIKSREKWDAVPVSPARMTAEVWEAIKGKDWVLTANTVKDAEWALRLWDFDKPYRHPGKHLGTATQIGMSLGIALAYKGTGKLVVDFQPDGDLMYDAGALWVAAHSKIPMLIVMNNNRCYYNSFNHQYRTAGKRGRSQEHARLGTEIDNPAPNYADLARSMGMYAEGPIENGNDLREALHRAIKVIEEQQVPALVDVVTQYR